jgi:GNAT superfamily N-acetyltransferase
MSIFDKYDLLDVDESITIPEITNNLGVVVVVGASGSGKTTILNKWGMKKPIIDTQKPVYKLFDSEEIAEKNLISAGLRTIPSWKRKITELSNGERHRVEVALCLASDDPFVDEFTSVVDRNTARALCHSINVSGVKNIKLASCHRDILDWIDFDSAYDTDSKCWIDRGSLRQNREVTFSVKQCSIEEAWRVFGKYHYLSSKFNKAATCYIAEIKGKCIAMTSFLAYPSGTVKDAWRGHRTIVLPEFQGMGIGNALSEAIANHIIKNGARFFSKTSHPSMGFHREKSKLWKPTSKNKKARLDYKQGRKSKEDGYKMLHSKRVCYSHEFIGDT